MHTAIVRTPPCALKWDALLCAGLSHLDPLHSVWKVTSEAIEELHQSLKSRPDESAMVEDPAGLKVSWEESHVPAHTEQPAKGLGNGQPCC